MSVMYDKRRPLYGVGVNDADYMVMKYEGKGEERRTTWRCPYYSRWVLILRRCYSEKAWVSGPTYKDCSVCDSCLLFSNFRKWMITKEYKGLHLDKDILVPQNKVYSPATCCFVPVRVNVFFCGANAIRGDYPIGVRLRSDEKKFTMECFNPFGKRYSGSYETPEEAHLAWRDRKIYIAYKLSYTEGLDERIVNILRDPVEVIKRLQS